MLVMHNAVPAMNIRELVALAKAQPGELSFATGGSGQSGHMAAELLKYAADLDIRHVPYKGVVAAIRNLPGGRITMMFSTMSVALPLVREGKLRAIAVTSLRRCPAAPELPTIAESRLSGIRSDGRERVARAGQNTGGARSQAASRNRQGAGTARSARQIFRSWRGRRRQFAR